MRCLIIVLAVLLLAWSAESTRLQSGQRVPRGLRGRECATNAECIRRGLPLRPPRPRRSVADNVPFAAFTFLSRAQTTTITQPGTYRISATGAQGGSQPAFQLAGGRGARVNATFALAAGDVINVYVGEPGVNFLPAGGGGGTFVLLGDTLLMAAGGGGGVGDLFAAPPDANTDLVSGSGLPGSSGGPFGGQGGQAGSGGQGGTGSYLNPPPAMNSNGGGGGGVLTRGGDGQGDFPGSGGGTLADGDPKGGLPFAAGGSRGGYGGGGGSSFCGGGGGGGYSGGGGGGCQDGTRKHGGGGGSWVNANVALPGTSTATITSDPAGVLILMF